MRADRLVSIVMLLQSRGKMTTQSLATELEVSRRTVLRDIEALSFAGVPIYTEGGHGGGVALDENYRTSLTGLKAEEVQALFVAGNNQLLHEIGLGEAAESTQRKLSAALPLQHQSVLNHIRQRIYIDPLWWWHDAQPLAFWDDLQAAVYQDRCVRVVYENYSGEVSERELEPYSLVAKSSLWYLVARQLGKEEEGLRIFRVARLRKLHLLQDHFQRASDFDLPMYWHEHLSEFLTSFSTYEFTLRIHPDRATLARQLTPGRNFLLAVDADGWLTVRFQIDNAELAKMLVFGLGSQCEVVDPPTLRDTMRQACQELIEHFQ